MASPPTAAIAEKKTVAHLINSEQYKKLILQAIPQHVRADVLMRVAITTIQKTPDLMACTAESLMGSVLECAQLGLMPDGILGQAYLVPYNNTKKNCKEAQLQIGWRGLIALARRSGEVSYVVAEAVYECDQFKVTYAPERSLSHDPDIDNEHRGEIDPAVSQFMPVGFRGAYALVKYKSGEYDFEYMPKHKIERIRSKSQAGSSPGKPWLTHYEEMARKTAIRALGKRLPLSAEFMRAANLDDLNEQGVETLDKQNLGDAILGQMADTKAEQLANKYAGQKTIDATAAQKDQEPAPQTLSEEPPLSAFSEGEAATDPTTGSQAEPAGPESPSKPQPANGTTAKGSDPRKKTLWPLPTQEPRT